MVGVLKPEISFLTGFLQSGQLVNGLAESGLRRVNFPPHTPQPSPLSNSYS
jgi:hypothetical protein